MAYKSFTAAQLRIIILSFLLTESVSGLFSLKKTAFPVMFMLIIRLFPLRSNRRTYAARVKYWEYGQALQPVPSCRLFHRCPGLLPRYLFRRTRQLQLATGSAFSKP